MCVLQIPDNPFFNQAIWSIEKGEKYPNEIFKNKCKLNIKYDNGSLLTDRTLQNAFTCDL